MPPLTNEASKKAAKPELKASSYHYKRKKTKNTSKQESKDKYQKMNFKLNKKKRI